LADAVFAEVFDPAGDAFEAAKVALKIAGPGAFGLNESGQPVDPDVHVVDVAERGLDFLDVLDRLVERSSVEGGEDFEGVPQSFGGDSEAVELFGEVGLARDAVVGEHLFEGGFDLSTGVALNGGVVGVAAGPGGADGEVVELVGHPLHYLGLEQPVHFTFERRLLRLALLGEAEAEPAEPGFMVGQGGLLEDVFDPGDLDVQVACVTEGFGHPFGLLIPAPGGFGGQCRLEGGEGGAEASAGDTHLVDGLGVTAGADRLDVLTDGGEPVGQHPGREQGERWVVRVGHDGSPAGTGIMNG
jgi:hypothetical protein